MQNDAVTGLPRLEAWLVAMHNRVNTKLKKPFFDPSVLPEPSLDVETGPFASSPIGAVWDFAFTVAFNYFETQDQVEWDRAFYLSTFFLVALPEFLSLLPLREAQETAAVFRSTQLTPSILETRASVIDWLFGQSPFSQTEQKEISFFIESRRAKDPACNESKLVKIKTTCKYIFIVTCYFQSFVPVSHLN
jgi:hypothetical protein